MPEIANFRHFDVNPRAHPDFALFHLPPFHSEFNIV